MQEPKRRFLYEVEPSTGNVIRLIGDTGLVGIKAIAFHPTTGTLFAHQNRRGTDSGSLYTLDFATALPTLIGDTHISASSLTFDTSGNLFGWLEFHDGTHPFDLDTLVTIDQFADASMQVGLTAVSASQVDTNQSGLAFDSQGVLHLKSGDLTASGMGANGPGRLYTVDPQTGAVTIGAELDPAPQNVLAFDHNDIAYTVSRRQGRSILQTINIADGSLADVGDIELAGTDIAGVTSVAFAPVAVVPEPSSLALWSIFTIAWCVRRRRELGK